MSRATSPCSVEGCGARRYGRGLCKTHYRQLPDVRASRNALERKRVRNLSGERLARHKAKARAKWRERNTGWSAEDVEEALRAQDGRCALCGVVLLQTGNRDPASMTADHDHETGRRRGLLCKVCNSLEGFHLQISVDEEEWARRVKAYRAKYR